MSSIISPRKAHSPVQRKTRATLISLGVATEPVYLCAVYLDGAAAHNNVGNALVTVGLEAGAHKVHFVIAPGRYTLGRKDPIEVDLQSDLTITMPLKVFEMGSQ